MENLNKYLTVRQVAEKLGLSEEWIRDLIHAKEIKAIKISQWRISPDSLENFIKSRSNLETV